MISHQRQGHINADGFLILVGARIVSKGCENSRTHRAAFVTQTTGKHVRPRHPHSKEKHDDRAARERILGIGHTNTLAFFRLIVQRGQFGAHLNRVSANVLAKHPDRRCVARNTLAHFLMRFAFVNGDAIRGTIGHLEGSLNRKRAFKEHGLAFKENNAITYECFDLILALR